jgi:NAD(P)-dependent dehydrogenase (short-subunit alcohol dehydrogenase family)
MRAGERIRPRREDSGVKTQRRDARGLNVLVTGAASGIGRSVAVRLGREGARLYLIDRNADGLEQTAASIRAEGGDVVLTQSLDITEIDAVREFADAVSGHVDALDAVINIAGIAIWGTVTSLTHEQWRRVIDVNLMGTVHVIECFVPPMVHAQRGGYLVNVSSAAGLIGLPWHAAYSASKFGVRGISEVLRFDLARHRIAVTLVCPGGVDTPLTETAEIAGIDMSSPVVSRFRHAFRRRAVSPDTAAARIVSGMLRRRYLVYTSGDIRLIHAVQRYVPPLYALIMRMFNRAADVVGAKAGAPDGVSAEAQR